MKLIRFFFYKIYSFSVSNGEKDAGWAMTIVSLFTLANVYSFFDIVLILIQTKLPQFGKPFIIIFCGIILYLNYSYLMKNGKANEIIKEFKEMKGNKRGLNLLLFFYIAFSIFLFIYTGNIIRGLNM